MHHSLTALALSVCLLGASCARVDEDPPPPPPPARVTQAAPGVKVHTQFIDDVQRRTFNWFWETTNPENGLVHDRWPAESFSSVAAVGFGLTAYGIGAEHGWVTRDAAAQRVLTTLRFFEGGVDGGVEGDQGFFYHFVDMKTGKRFKDVELSTMDTALFMAGALFCQSYFDRDDETERAIRETAERLYTRVQWNRFHERPPLISMGWTPEKGLHDWDYTGYNEAMILYILAIGSPTHPVSPEAWTAYTASYKWQDDHVVFAPLFGHQFSHVWIDFRGIRDPYMRARGIDYFENARRATLWQRNYAIRNPHGWRGYGETVWGLSACDGPFDGKLTIGGVEHEFHTYAARGAAPNEVRDDGTIAPTAAISSIAFTPNESIAAAHAMFELYGDNLYQKYGFLDSFNPTLDFDRNVQMGRIVPGIGWFDNDYLGIDQGPIVAMIENYKSELVWKTMRKNEHVRRGLTRAGFTGGWLAE